MPGTFWDQTNWSCCLGAKWMEKFINIGFCLPLLTFSLPPLPLRQKENIIFQIPKLWVFFLFENQTVHLKRWISIYDNYLATASVLRFWQTFSKEICKWHGFLCNWSWVSESFQYSRNCCPRCLAFWMYLWKSWQGTCMYCTHLKQLLSGNVEAELGLSCPGLLQAFLGSQTLSAANDVG